MLAALVIASVGAVSARAEERPLFKQIPAPSGSRSVPRAAQSEPLTTTLTIRGGISLGSYEAGLNWGILALARRTGQPGQVGGYAMNLRALTGASAGNINAFLSAISWCQTSAYQDRETATDNLFWHAWIPVGWERLFPDADFKSFNDDDGLFTRKAFGDIETNLVKALATPDRYDDRCTSAAPLRVGVTVTRSRPESLCLGGQGGQTCAAGDIEIKSQRFFVALGAARTDGGLRFLQVPVSSKLAGKQLRLRTDRDGYVSMPDVISVMEASSAFPVAFGPRRVFYCNDQGAGAPTAEGAYNAGRACEVGQDYFFDGGVFDNVPLGLAASLLGDQAKEAYFMYLDPGQVRPHQDLPSGDPASFQGATGRGLSNTLAFLGNFIDVSSQYELQTAFRTIWPEGSADTLGVPKPRLSTRFHGIVGEFLGHFAGFLARPFREYDYFVGLYDALWHVADFSCSDERNFERKAMCWVRYVRQTHDELGLSRTPRASLVVRRLLDDEIRARAGVDAIANRVLASVATDSGETAAAWISRAAGLKDIDAKGVDQAKVMNAIVTVQLRRGALRRAALEGRSTQAEQIDSQYGFVQFASALREESKGKFKLADYFSEREVELVDDPGRWFKKTAPDVAERLNSIEWSDGFKIGQHVTATAQMVVHSEPLNVPRTLELDPSSVPDRRWTGARILSHLLPFELAFSERHGGLELSYRPSLFLHDRFALVAPIVPFIWRRGDQTLAFMDRRPGHSLSFAFGAGTLWRSRNGLFFSGLQLVPWRFFYRWEEHWPDQANLDPSASGGEIGAYFLAGKLHLALGVDRYSQFKSFREWDLRIGISDLNGLIYWLTRIAAD